MVFDPAAGHFAASQRPAIHRHTAPSIGSGVSFYLPAGEIFHGSGVGEGQFLTVPAERAESREQMMFRHKAPLLHTAHEDACTQNMKIRLRESRRQQNAAAMHHGRALCQLRETFLRKFPPCSEALGGRCIPCPSIPAAGAAALHGLPASPAVLPPGAAAIRRLCGFLGLAAFGLFACFGGSGQPELFFGGVLAGNRQSPGRTGFDEPGHEVALTALTGPDAAHLAHVQRQTTGAVGLALTAEGIVHIAQHIGQRELRVALQECATCPSSSSGAKVQVE